MILRSHFLEFQQPYLLESLLSLLYYGKKYTETELKFSAALDYCPLLDSEGICNGVIMTLPHIAQAKLISILKNKTKKRS